MSARKFFKLKKVDIQKQTKKLKKTPKTGPSKVAWSSWFLKTRAGPGRLIFFFLSVKNLMLIPKKNILRWENVGNLRNKQYKIIGFRRLLNK